MVCSRLTIFSSLNYRAFLTLGGTFEIRIQEASDPKTENAKENIKGTHVRKSNTARNKDTPYENYCVPKSQKLCTLRRGEGKTSLRPRGKGRPPTKARKINYFGKKETTDLKYEENFFYEVERFLLPNIKFQYN